MKDNNRYDDAPDFAEEGSVVTESAEVHTLTLLAEGEINQQITTAKRFPRKIRQFIDTATELATLDEATADECIYALPRDGKTIEGPSARFAEILAYAWTNCRVGARTVSEDGDFVTAQGAFYDLQNNVAISYEVKRRIVDKNGRRYKADMIGMTGNAACSVALRNAVLKGIPKAIWKKIYDRARSVVAGDFKTLANRRAEAMKQFQLYGVTPDMIFGLLHVRGVEDVTLDHLVTLKGVLTAIKEGDTTLEQVFSPEATQDPTLARKSADNLNAIKDRHTPQNGATAQPDPPQASEPTAEVLTPEEKARVEARREELKQQADQVSRQHSTRQDEPMPDSTPSEPQEVTLDFGTSARSGHRSHGGKG